MAISIACASGSFASDEGDRGRKLEAEVFRELSL